MNIERSKHTSDMLKERNIPEEWMWRTINNPDWENTGSDNNIHYFKSIEEHGGRILHVVLNPHTSPKKKLRYTLTVGQGGNDEIKSR